MSKVNVRVTGLTVVDRPPNERGYQVLAYFDCKVWGLRLRGCQLFATPEGEVTVGPPSIPGPEGQRRAVEILDPFLRVRMIEVAMPSYRMLGGGWQEVVERSATCPPDISAPVEVDR